MNDTTQITPRTAATITPAVDIVENSEGITLWADLPGVPREKLDVKVHDARLYIEAEAVVPVQPELRVHHAEIRAPRFARAFTVSEDFDTTKIDANLTNGVLKLSIPRRETARPRKVEVSVN
jgi:HSP20 family protein